MKTEKEIKLRLKEEIEEISINTLERKEALFFNDFGWVKALSWVLRN